eukprot:CAMPEP_0115873370 /NCGR_PEP_ID=MMETSP0287-20121206/23959_1 /TAXON_ID=412157 /ORGANISM="Chrysochromulina rotalis, Strain UIO044" /LENGTH=104 /DNA_ID=CAMNT_0003328425 /DNA_START=181 /DNA_END=495 /DNA_ORIENTATION=-
MSGSDVLQVPCGLELTVADVATLRPATPSSPACACMPRVYDLMYDLPYARCAHRGWGRRLQAGYGRRSRDWLVCHARGCARVKADDAYSQSFIVRREYRAISVN